MFIYSGNSDKSKKLVEATLDHYPVEYESVETYPIISSAEAWEILEAGKGFVAYIDAGVTQAVVRKVFLAYYDSETPQHYLQPIYVFQGDNNFYGYVPAIRTAAQSSKRK